ncbi:hypothetical protein KDD17_03885 [Sulfitobacter albidus]|uniref:DUF1127 domain-containing protein n=1 Tax=Sulfitobacter albidus TaxID=2829501 RepID=A0A975JGI3_9RHOB|nr:hypothetical protein [Sulfitobacter albidus]QUJ78099.1 hypothetical protein KDD17_03885 [Sulfitobacter albidus]
MTYQHTATDHFSAKMPGAGLSTAPAPFLSAGRALRVTGAFFSSLMGALMRASTSAARVDQCEALRAKSDAELAKMGIKRDEIAHYVFKDLMYL